MSGFIVIWLSTCCILFHLEVPEHVLVEQDQKDVETPDSKIM
jgi:hypothetical protein